MSLTRLKITFRETAYRDFYERKIWQQSTFFIDYPDQKFFQFQNPLVCKHSYCSPHSIWTNCCLAWKKFFVKLHNDTFFSGKFDNHMSNFFVDNPDQIFVLIQNLLGSLYSHSSPHSLLTCPWLDWKTLFVKLHTHTFWVQSLTTTWVLFS